MFFFFNSHIKMQTKKQSRAVTTVCYTDGCHVPNDGNLHNGKKKLGPILHVRPMRQNYNNGFVWRLRAKRD